MLEPIIADNVSAAVNGVAAQVLNVDGSRGTADESLQLGLVEHGKPARLDHATQAPEKSGGLEIGLNLQAVSRHVADVD
ncbi:unnamed protein product [Periconia digitata]|uniref:Uncharacterized protein n=1 Tax=Periconia digitata TaxID=1303443 RepID=A0A9W4XFX7_9PLEO|nr:unnamed protein product [Periconia digitata]